MNKHEAAGRLLELAVRHLRRIDHGTPEGAELPLNWALIERVARVVADRGIEAGIGFADGYWYGVGNMQAESNATWRAIRDALGEPVKWGEAA